MQKKCLIVHMHLVKNQIINSDILCCDEKLLIMQRIITVRANHYMFFQLSIINTTEEPKRSLNN